MRHALARGKRIGKISVWFSTSAQPEFLVVDQHDVTRAQLPAPAHLHLAVDPHPALAEQQPDVRSQLDRIGELEELTQPDPFLIGPGGAHLAHRYIISHVADVLAGSGLMSGATPATAALDWAGIGYTLHSYHHDSRSDSYGDEAVAALGLDPRRIFKTLIASVDSTLSCAVVPVAGRLNLKALAAALGGRRAELAHPAQAQRATGYVLGGISPLGHRKRLRVVLDSSAAGFDTVFVSAGRRGLQVELAPADLIRVSAALSAAIATT